MSASRSSTFEPPERATRALALRATAFLVASVVFLYVAAARAEWVIDDSFIYQRIVRNALNGYGLSYSFTEPVEGFSSPLWALLLTGLGELGFRGFVPARILGIVCVLAVLALAAFAPSSGRGTRGAWSHVTVLLMIALQPSLALWTISGMETPLCVLLAMVLVVAVRMRSVRTASAVAGLMAIARPEGVLFTASTILWATFVLAADRRTLSRTLRSLALPVGLALSPWLAWEAYRLVHYGRFVSNSADAKLAFDAIVTTPTPVVRSLSYVLSSFGAFPGEWLLFITGVALLALGCRGRDARPLVLFGIVSSATVVAFTVVVRGDWMPECRFLLPLVPVFVVTALDGVDDLRGWAGRAMTSAVAIAMLLSGLRHYFEIYPAHSPFLRPPAVVTNASVLALLRPVKADAWSHEYARFALRYTRAGESVLHLDVGQSGYLFSDLSILDQFGLVSKFECDVVRDRRTAREMVEHFRRESPSVAFVLVEQGTTTPATKVARTLGDELAERYVPMWRHSWWGPHEMLVMVRRDALSRRVDPERLAGWIDASRGLAWDREKLLAE